MHLTTLLIVKYALAYINPLQVGVGKIIDYRLSVFEKKYNNQIRQYAHGILGTSSKALGGVDCRYNNLANSMTFSDQQLAKDMTQSTWYLNDKTGTMTYYTDSKTKKATVAESYAAKRHINGAYCVKGTTPKISELYASYSCFGLPTDSNGVNQYLGHVENNELWEAHSGIVGYNDYKIGNYDSLKEVLVDYSFYPQLDQNSRMRHYLTTLMHNPARGGSMFSRLGLDGKCCAVGKTCDSDDITKTCQAGQYPTVFCRPPTDHSVLDTTNIGDDHGKRVFVKLSNKGESEPFKGKVVSLDELVSSGGGMLLSASSNADVGIPSIDQCFKEATGSYKKYNVSINAHDTLKKVNYTKTEETTIQGYFRSKETPHTDATALVNKDVNKDIECFAAHIAGTFPVATIQKEIVKYLTHWSVYVARTAKTQDDIQLLQFFKARPNAFDPESTKPYDYMDEINVIRMHIIYPLIIADIKSADCATTGADVSGIDYVGMIQGLTARLMALSAYRSSFTMNNHAGIPPYTSWDPPLNPNLKSVATTILTVMKNSFPNMVNKCPLSVPIVPNTTPVHPPTPAPTRGPSGVTSKLSSALGALLVMIFF